jgi:hypothetical protein
MSLAHVNTHTPEPWEAKSPCPGECCWVLKPVNSNAEFDHITSPELSESDAKRIVACVNACKGISTEKLLAPGMLVNIPDDHNIIKQRDYYLSALRAARRAIRKIKRETNQHEEGRKLCIKADKRASIALAKGFT